MFPYEKPNERHYGVKSISHLKDTIALVVKKLGGGPKARDLLLETTAVETHCGLYPDRHPEKWGVGISQCDQIALDDVQMHLKPHHRRKIFRDRELGFDVKELKLEDLAFDPLKAMVVCRLHYMRIPAAIPEDLWGRAQYWKDHYNRSGAGTPEHYLETVAEILGEEWK